MKFLIQTILGKIKHDFSFTLIESVNYQNWYSRSNSFEYKTIDELKFPLDFDFKGYVPIGSVEFVIDYLQVCYNLTPKPKNIPVELMSGNFTKRRVINGTELDIIGEKFVKSNDKIKSFTEICKSAPSGNYQISDLININSEWRAFVYERKLVGLQNYSGEFDLFPNVEKIKEMINSYKSQPIAYTLDVGIIDLNETVIIEVHDFFSCGLYGFANHKLLPFMFNRWFHEFVS